VPIKLSIPVYSFISITLPISAARFELQLAPDHLSGKAGQMGGVIATDALVAELHNLLGLAGKLMGQDLCVGGTWDSLQAQLEQASDIMQDGTQDPDKECDGISMGLSFESGPALLGEAGLGLLPTPDGCAGN
jgi:hypothetical protein